MNAQSASSKAPLGAIVLDERAKETLRDHYRQRGLWKEVKTLDEAFSNLELLALIRPDEYSREVLIPAGSTIQLSFVLRRGAGTES